jgi:DIM1 family U5 snRNP protein
VAERVKNFAVIYLVDISAVPDFNAMYELYDPCTIMFFFRNKVGHVAPGSEGKLG